jgi:hypothetical protein
MKSTVKELTVLILQECPSCKQLYTILVPKPEYDLWCSGELIQKALVHTPTKTRESLLSGLCVNCQDIVFNNDMYGQE